MQPGRRRCNRSGFACINGLVALRVVGFGRARDVGRQRYLAEAVEHGRRIGVELDAPEVAVAPGHRELRPVPEPDHGAGP
jgi:hypothetical protein